MAPVIKLAPLEAEIFVLLAAPFIQTFMGMNPKYARIFTLLGNREWENRRSNLMTPKR